MTSSFDNFGNVVGTPRDKLPDISDTNYLATEADLTEAVNKEIDANIKDTKEFFDDMMKIEENRYKARDKRLEYIFQITGKIGELAKAIKANNATERENDARLSTDRADRNELINLGDNAHTYTNVLLNKEIEDEENPARAEVQEILANLADKLNPDVDQQTFLNGYDKETLGAAFRSAYDALKVDQSTNQLDGADQIKFIKRLISNKIHVDALNRGYDIDSGRYEKNYLNIVLDKLDKLEEQHSWMLSDSISANRKAYRKEQFENKILDSARNISKLPKNGQDLTTFSDTKTGLIRQLSFEYFSKEDQPMSKAMDLYFDVVSKAVENGGLSVDQGNDILNNLPYVDRSRKPAVEYENIVEYAATLSPNSKHFGKVTARIEQLQDAIRSQNKEEETNDTQQIQDARNVHKRNFDKLMDQDRAPTPTEIYKLYSEFTGDPNSYKAGHRLKGDIPQWLKSSLTGLDLSGNEQIQNKLKYANLINDQSSVLRLAVANYLKKKVNELTVEDEFLVQQLEQELGGSIALGTSGVKSDFQIHLDKGLDPLSFIADEVSSLNARLEAGEFDTFITDTSPKLAYQKQDMAEQYLRDPDSINDSNVKPGEALWLEKSVAHIRSGGVLYPEVVEWWKEFKVMDEDGYYKRPREFMMQRLEAVGAFKDTTAGKIIPKEKEFLEPEMFNYQTKNGLHGTLTVMTAVDDNGELYAKQVLDTFEAPEAVKGYHNLKGYDYHSGSADFGELIGNPFKFSVDSAGNISPDRRFVSVQTRDVTNKFGGGVYEQAQKHPSMKLGRYGITGKELTELFDANDGALKRTIKDGQKFDENFQDYLAFELIRHKLNRMNSIRGMSVQGGKVTTKLTTFSLDEQEALNELFPRLKNYTMSQLQNLTPQIAEVILSDLEKGIKPEKPKKRTGRFER